MVRSGLDITEGEQPRFLCLAKWRANASSDNMEAKQKHRGGAIYTFQQDE